MTFGNSSSGSNSFGSSSSFGNSAGGGSKWPSRKIQSQSFASRRGAGATGSGGSSSGGFGGAKGTSKFSPKFTAKKRLIDDMAWDIEKTQSKKILKDADEKQKEYWKSIKLSEESEDVIKLLEDTTENLFITGRAGTGKSTLLGYFREHTKKNVVVIAPTGVAALNVKGQTIHSFFKFKIGVTEHDIRKITGEIDQKLYQKIDTLIVDEISMVRADLFDCIDRFMRVNGKDQDKPFGGAQVVVIGDLFQLPPVVGPGEQYIFETKYESPYFFDSKAYKQGDFQVVELSHVYRQNDPVFIDILDKIRTGEADMQHVEYINRVCLEVDRSYGPPSSSQHGGPQSGSSYGDSSYSRASAVRESVDFDAPVYVNDEGVPVDEDGEGSEFQSVSDPRATYGSKLGESSRTPNRASAPAPSSLPKKNSLVEDLQKQFGLKTGVDFSSKSSPEQSSGPGAPSASLSKQKFTVYLVTTNALAETINNKKIEELKGLSKTYKGALVGRFDQKNTPAPESLVIKVGAQVMTLKNEPSGKWVNGDIGIVEKMLDASVRVRFEDGRVEEIVADSWEMVKYEYDELADHLESEVVGKYSQIPIKLAWAVTIHKSQGKTFDTAIIDFGKGTFAHGQAYVALSRVRSLEGITLKNPLRAQDVRIDERIRDFLSGARG